ncbi:MAG: nuclear transport factor 2 family protein, partial [Actinomycetota bacterium]|nr:nuclear transport factor 2 family protein [Actinomycetota bacterium]
FQAVASRLSGGHDVSYTVMTFDVSEDMAWTAGFVRFTGTMDGGPPRQIALRITHIYRREDQDWKVIHEHSDFQPADATAVGRP